MNAIAEIKQDFTMHPALLTSVIKSQAGTLSKALLEGVMNSIDAGCTRVDIELSQVGFVIRDNGKGFSTDEEITEWFGRFGTPHVEGDATFGKFRMGRGQLMAFAVNVWRSNDFVMRVDIENEGLTYGLSRSDHRVEGCVIEGALYRHLDETTLKETLIELREAVAYALKPVFVNGELVGKAAARRKGYWTSEDDDAYYKVIPGSNELLVYNQGIFVEKRGIYQTGMGGVVVSKAPLIVNFARNSVMAFSCSVWQRITKKLEAEVLGKLVTAKKLQDGERQFLARRIGTLESSGLDNWKQAKVLTDPSGKHYALAELAKFKDFVFLDHGSLACAVHGRDSICVVTQSMLDRFGESSMDEWLQDMRYRGLVRNDYSVRTVASVKNLAPGGTETFSESFLQPRQRAAFAALEWLNTEVAKYLSRAGYGDAPRDLLPGRQKKGNFVAWTDGKTYITANKDYLKLFEKGLDGITEWALVLIHEYMHDTDDSESHSHGEVFYRKWHDVVISGTPLSTLAQGCLRKYLEQLTERGLSRPRELSRQLLPLRS